MLGGPAAAVPPGAGIDVLAEETPRADAPANLALEEALVRAKPPRPLLRVWQNSACVVVGRGQRVLREVNLAACARGGVPVLRRASGGGAVYHDLGNLNISIAVPGYVPGLRGELARLVAEAIKRLGLTPTIGERGLYVGPDKVSGLAAQLTRAGSLAHATLLVTTPAACVSAYLAPVPQDPRPLDSLRARVRPLREHRPAVDIAVSRAAVLAAATARYGGLAPRPPRATEHRWRDRLLIDRYQDSAWHLTGRPKSRCDPGSTRDSDPGEGLPWRSGGVDPEVVSTKAGGARGGARVPRNTEGF
jgi:lipoate-protein ligase A